MTDPIEIRNGHVIVRDDDGEAITLTCQQALAVAQAVETNRDQLDQIRARLVIAAGLDTVRSLLLRSDLPQPRGISAYDSNYDPTVDVDLRTDDDLRTWVGHLGCEVEPLSHPTLGRRLTARHGALLLAGPWDRIVPEPGQTSEADRAAAAQVNATSGAGLAGAVPGVYCPEQSSA